MKKCCKGLLVLAIGLALPAALLANNQFEVKAFDDFVNEEGNTQYGWHLVANETNQKIWEFDENGEVAYCWAGDGDISAQRVYNYALRNLAIQGDDSYTVSATFVPDPDSDLSAERTYGIVCWYQDADNYLIYWMQQKTAGDWSGQFYGRVDGSLRQMYMPQKYNGSIGYVDGWMRSEYYDMWWDQGAYTHPEILMKRNALITTTVGLKVVSSIEEVTVGGTATTCRKFELHQIVNNEDHVSCEFYVKQIDANSGEFYTGVYSEMFNIGIEDFEISCTNTDFTKPVVEAINALPETIDNVAHIGNVVEARNSYNGLLSYQSNVAADVVSKLENAETSVGAYVDSVILALDKTQPTFVADVEAALKLYESLSVELQEKVSKTAELAQAIEDAENWVDPSQKPSDNPSEDPSENPSEEPSTQPSEKPSDEPSTQPSTQPSEDPVEPTEPEKGCKGSAGATAGILGLLFTALLALKKKR